MYLPSHNDLHHRKDGEQSNCSQQSDFIGWHCMLILIPLPLN